MIKTYLVPITDELIKAMEKGEAPSFLHCATCLDELTNGEVLMKMFPNMEVEADELLIDVRYLDSNNSNDIMQFYPDWWNRKWGE